MAASARVMPLVNDKLYYRYYYENDDVDLLSLVRLVVR